MNPLFRKILGTQVLFAAVESVGRKTLLFRDDKLLCTVRVSGGMSLPGHSGLSQVSIQFDKPDFDNLIRPLWPSCRLEDDPDMGVHKFCFFRYSAVYGLFMDHNVDSAPDAELQALDAWLAGTMIVDEFNFRWSMVPDHFKSMPGYAATREEARIKT